MTEELSINYNEFVKWLESYNSQVIGVTHSSSHSFFAAYLKEKTPKVAVYVFLDVTKVCKNSNWKEYTNPEWVTKLINETNQLHRTEDCNRFNIGSLGKKLTKLEVLKCIDKLSNRPKKKIKKAA